MNAKDAARRILTEAGEPLHYREITRRAIEAGLWESHGKTPEATLNAQLTRSIKHDGEASPFRRVGRGVFTLNEDPSASLISTDAAEKLTQRSGGSMTFADSAEKVLRRYAGKKPMHYRDITERALADGFLRTRGQTPEATMYAQIIQEEQRRKKRGERLRFERFGKGLVGLADWKPTGLAHRIALHNAEIRRKFHKRITELTPTAFEALIGRLLTVIGFNNVEVTKVSSDGGIDVRGTLVVGEAIRTRMAVQAKKWKNNVQAPTVQQVRGSLGAHEQGLIISTSGFSKGAREEARRLDAIPVGLMDGMQFVGLLVEHGIGIVRTREDILDLSPEGFEGMEEESGGEDA